MTYIFTLQVLLPLMNGNQRSITVHFNQEINDQKNLMPIQTRIFFNPRFLAKLYLIKIKAPLFGFCAKSVIGKRKLSVGSKLKFNSSPDLKSFKHIIQNFYFNGEK
jgi:hypothetical protein